MLYMINIINGPGNAIGNTNTLYPPSYYSAQVHSPFKLLPLPCSPPPPPPPSHVSSVYQPAPMWGVWAVRELAVLWGCGRPVSGGCSAQGPAELCPPLLQVGPA